MTNEEFKQARINLGLSISQLSKILNTNPVTIRRWEASKGVKTSRDPNPIACQVLNWLQSGQLKINL
jgi:DNA-binding transcriptional regulator YiaG